MTRIARPPIRVQVRSPLQGVAGLPCRPGGIGRGGEVQRLLRHHLAEERRGHEQRHPGGGRGGRGKEHADRQPGGDSAGEQHRRVGRRRGREGLHRGLAGEGRHRLLRPGDEAVEGGEARGVERDGDAVPDANRHRARLRLRDEGARRVGHGLEVRVGLRVPLRPGGVGGRLQPGVEPGDLVEEVERRLAGRSADGACHQLDGPRRDSLRLEGQRPAVVALDRQRRHRRDRASVPGERGQGGRHRVRRLAAQGADRGDPHLARRAADLDQVRGVDHRLRSGLLAARDGEHSEADQQRFAHPLEDTTYSSRESAASSASRRASSRWAQKPSRPRYASAIATSAPA